MQGSWVVEGTAFGRARYNRGETAVPSEVSRYERTRVAFISPVPDIVCFDIVHRDRIPPRGIAMETSALRANQTTLLQE